MKMLNSVACSEFLYPLSTSSSRATTIPWNTSPSSMSPWRRRWRRRRVVGRLASSERPPSHVMPLARYTSTKRCARLGRRSDISGRYKISYYIHRRCKCCRQLSFYDTSAVNGCCLAVTYSNAHSNLRAYIYM